MNFNSAVDSCQRVLIVRIERVFEEERRGMKEWQSKKEKFVSRGKGMQLKRVSVNKNRNSVGSRKADVVEGSNLYHDRWNGNVGRWRYVGVGNQMVHSRAGHTQKEESKMVRIGAKARARKADRTGRQGLVSFE